MRAVFLLENRRFFNKIYGHESSVFLDNGRFFVFTKYGHETSYFSVKNRKKGHPIDFMGPYYSVIFIEITFFDQIMS